MSNRAKHATRWYVYALADSEGAIRYVGFTHDIERRQREHINEARQGRLTLKDTWVRTLLADGQVPRITVLESGEGSGSTETEVRWIDQVRTSELLNVTIGGDGTKGYHHSEQTRQKIADSNRRLYALGLRKPTMNRLGVKLTPEQRERLRSAHLGQKQTEATKAKRSTSLIGRHPWTHQPDEVRERNRDRARRLREKRVAMGLDPYPHRRRNDT